MEIVVFFIEYSIYRKCIESINEKRVLIYTLIANGVTCVVGLVMFKIYWLKEKIFTPYKKGKDFNYYIL